MSNDKKEQFNMEDGFIDFDSKTDTYIKQIEPEFIEEQPDETVKNYITRNKKKYYKTERNYIYRCEDGFYAYRIVHKPSKTNSFVNRHKDTKERFNTEYKAFKALEDHIKKLSNDLTYKNREITLGDVWKHIKNTAVKEEATFTKYDSLYTQHISYVILFSGSKL